MCSRTHRAHDRFSLAVSCLSEIRAALLPSRHSDERRVGMITVVVARTGELADIQRQMKIARSFNVGEALLEEGWLGGQECLLVRSGIGRQHAEQAMQFVLQRYRPAAILLLGCCGALAAKLRVGDLVVCSQLLALPLPPTPSHLDQLVGPLNCDDDLVQHALHVALPQTWGRATCSACCTK